MLWSKIFLFENMDNSKWRKGHHQVAPRFLKNAPHNIMQGLKVKTHKPWNFKFAHAVVQSHPQCCFLIMSVLVNGFVTSVKSCFVSQTIVHLVDLCFFQCLQSKYVFNCMLLPHLTVCKASCPMLLSAVFNVFCSQFLAKLHQLKINQNSMFEFGS